MCNQSEGTTVKSESVQPIRTRSDPKTVRELDQFVFYSLAWFLRLDKTNIYISRWIFSLGLGFADRGDSFDFNIALNEHFKALRVDAEIAKEEEEPRERLDLALKEGQTIKVCSL